MRRLIMNADDFGLSEGVTRGVLEAHEAGTVTSTSMLVTTPGWEEAARRARALVDRLGVGLHVDFVVGRPVERVASLTDPRTGAFLSLPALAARTLAGRLDPAEIAAECAAQLARLAAAGIAATHLDSHRHTHCLPGFWRPVVEAALAAGVRVVCQPVEFPWRGFPGGACVLKRAAIATSWWIASARGPRARHADHFVGISLQGVRSFGPRLLGALDQLRPGTTEIMVHPGHVDPSLPAAESYTWQRELELEALCSSEVRARLGRGDLELVHFGAL